MDFGGVPDFVDPGKKRKIERGGHPYAANKGFPKQPGPQSYPTAPVAAAGGGQALPAHPAPGGGKIQSYAELVASDSYVDIVRKLAKYAGIPVGQVHPGRLMQLVGQAMGNAMQAQSRHKVQMEQAAVETVLSLPEFELLKEAVESGNVKIDAKLVTEVDPTGLHADPEDPTEAQEQELQIAEIAQELNAEKDKRRMLNLMIQGIAADKSYAFHMMDQLLNRINPQLVKQYGLLMAFGDFMHWAMSEDDQAAQHRAGGEGGDPWGLTWLEFHDDGTVTIHAVARLLPLLIHELVKGIMEWLSHNSEDPDDLRKQVQGQVDTTDNEGWDIPMGSAVWRQIERMIGNDNRRYMPFVQRHISRLPPEQFHEFVRGLLSGDQAAQRQVQQIIQQAKAGEAPMESLQALEIANRLLG